MSQRLRKILAAAIGALANKVDGVLDEGGRVRSPKSARLSRDAVRELERKRARDERRQQKRRVQKARRGF